MTTAIVGDVHGMLAPLQALVQRLALGAGDRLVFIGDLVDKGPQPAGVIRFVRQLHTEAPVETVLIEGNHENRHRRYWLNKSARPKVAREMAAAAAELPGLDAELTEDDRAFLATAIPFLRIPEWNLLAVHGGIPGSMRAFPDSLDEVAGMTGKARNSFLKVLRARFIERETGDYLALGNNQPGDPFWAERYDGRFGHVVFGHQPFPEGPACYPHATGIDTGAVHGGTLTALVLPEEGEAHFTSVPGGMCRPYRAAERISHPGSGLSLRRGNVA